MSRFHAFHLPHVGRLFLGATWIAGAIFNTLWTLPNASELWSDFGDTATFAPYRSFFGSVAAAAPEFWAVMLILAELVLGVLLLAHDPWASWGVLLSLAWGIFLFFIIWPYTLSTVIFIALAAVLLRYERRVGIVDVLRHRDMSGVAHHRGA